MRKGHRGPLGQHVGMTPAKCRQRLLRLVVLALTPPSTEPAPRPPRRPSPPPADRDRPPRHTSRAAAASAPAAGSSRRPIAVSGNDQRNQHRTNRRWSAKNARQRTRDSPRKRGMNTRHWPMLSAYLNSGCLHQSAPPLTEAARSTYVSSYFIAKPPTASFNSHQSAIHHPLP